MKRITKLSIFAFSFVLLFFVSCCDKKSKDSIGEIITFGSYQWRILDIQDDRALVISERVISPMYYHISEEDITWENSSLRSYLNDEFYNSFNATDRARIIEVNNINLHNPWYGTNGGSNTDDKIFLLSLAEVVKYFGNSGQLYNRPSSDASLISDRYNSRRKAMMSEYLECIWWLRSPGSHNSTAAYVNFEGYISVEGRKVDTLYRRYAVRPVMWLYL